MDRSEVLETARAAITGGRQDAHGQPEMTFVRIAALWNAYLDEALTPVDVANMMILLKVARAQANPRHEDHGVDIAGYAALAVELATESKPMRLAVPAP